MVREHICDVLLLLTLISLACGAEKCIYETESGKKSLCCADYEETENDCVVCSIGYTSDPGQKCRPCPSNTYGERCAQDCFCSALEICDNVEGCVIPSTIISEQAASISPNLPRMLNKTTAMTPEKSTENRVQDDRTSQLITGTGTYSGSDITSAYDKEIKGCSIQGLLSREIIVYSTLSVVVIGFGICLCFVVLKYKSLTKKKVITINQTQHSSIPQHTQNIEIADRLYEIINEEDLLDDRRIQQIQKEMSSEYLDVIHDSNTRDSCESKSLDKQDNPCQLLSIIQTLNQVRNLKGDDLSLMSGDSTSSSNEYQWDSTQDYLNPYQPMIDIAPPVEHKYLTVATTHSKIDGHYKDSAIVRNKHELQHPREVEKDIIAKCWRNYFSVGFGSNESKSVSNRKGGKESKSYENLNVEQLKMTFNSEKEDKKDQIE